VTGWLTPIRDRPSSERERNVATTAVLAGIIAAVLALALTRGDPGAPAETRPSSTPTPAVHSAPAQAPVLSQRSAVAVARRFLAGYLAYAYGRAPAAGVPEASEALIASLERHPPRVTVARQARLPRVEQLVVTFAQSGRPVVNAVLNDGGIVNYTVELVLAQSDGRLIVGALEPAQ
jgi:hypothetical protein